MNDQLKESQRAVESWHLGQTSARYESSGLGAGVISTGKGDHGGVSYGAYQLSTKMGTLQEYLSQSPYGEQFKGLAPATPAFNAKWKELAKSDPGFAQDQHDFIGRSHYGEQVAALKSAGIDLSDRGRAVQDALWSTSVQFRGLTPRIFAKGIAEKFGPDCKVAELSDRDIVEAVQDYKIAHNATLFRSSPEWQPGLLKRARAERAALVELATQEELLRNNGVQVDRANSEQRPGGTTPSQHSRALHREEVLREDAHGTGVRALQDQLSALGYTDPHNHPLKIDGDFGPNTTHAVRAFQQAHGLHVDGIVGRDTREALARAERTPLLSEAMHPHHALFDQARQGLRQLPPGSFHNDRELNNLAAALALKARENGVTRIDHVLMNTRGDGVCAVQGNPLDPARHVVLVDKAQAAAQTVAHSTELMAAQDSSRLHAAQAQVQLQHQEHRAGLSIVMRP